MFFFHQDNFIPCNICGEMNELSNQTCQNCRARIRRRNRRSNSIFNRVNKQNYNYFNVNKNETFKQPVREELEIKKMTFSLYGVGKNNRLEPPICCICQDNIEYGHNIYLLSCNHCYHQYCIRKWLKQKSECPYCRKKFYIVFK